MTDKMLTLKFYSILYKQIKNKPKTKTTNIIVVVQYEKLIFILKITFHRVINYIFLKIRLDEH